MDHIYLLSALCRSAAPGQIITNNNSIRTPAHPAMLVGQQPVCSAQAGLGHFTCLLFLGEVPTAFCHDKTYFWAQLSSSCLHSKPTARLPQDWGSPSVTHPPPSSIPAHPALSSWGSSTDSCKGSGLPWNSSARPQSLWAVRLL